MQVSDTFKYLSISTFFHCSLSFLRSVSETYSQGRKYKISKGLATWIFIICSCLK